MLRLKDTPSIETFADLLKRLGSMAPWRVRLNPLPGKATEKDLLRLNERTNRVYELVDGVLVEKVMGGQESTLAMWLGHLLQTFLDQHDLGYLMGEAGPTRLMAGLVRVPDLSFISWEQLPGHEVPKEPIVALAPYLAVEVLSPSNRRAEMRRKLREYFLAGVRLVWLVDPDKRVITVYTTPDESVMLTEKDTLEGGDVLPGLALQVKQVFARLPPRSGGKRRRPRNR